MDEYEINDVCAECLPSLMFPCLPAIHSQAARISTVSSRSVTMKMKSSVQCILLIFSALTVALAASDGSPRKMSEGRRTLPG